MVGCPLRSEAGSHGGLLLYPPKRRTESWSLHHDEIMVVWIQPIGNQCWQRKGGKLVGSILDRPSQVDNWGEY